jgi:2-desacetyl-2-hydroxyethyl bacteriochlorophyllide A dehydrogenase
MFRDDEKIKLIPVNEVNDVGVLINSYKEILDNLVVVGLSGDPRIGIEHVDFYLEQGIHLDRAFYLMAGVPFEEKVSKFYFERNPEQEKILLSRLNPDNLPYIFVHDDASRGLNMDMSKIRDDLLVIRPTQGFRLFDYLGVIENAEEVHVMESCFQTIIDLQNYNKNNIYLHKYIRNYGGVLFPEQTHDYIIINQEKIVKAAVLVELDSDLKIANVELTSLKPGQVLVKVLVSGICGSQLHEISGNKGNGKFLPHLMGHEGCGIVEEVGEGVTTVKVGDKVVMHWRKGSGMEAPFPSYNIDGKTMSSGKVTTLSEYSIVSENRLTAIPQDTPNDFAALLGCGLTTALGIVDNECDLRMGESVAVVGCGGVGLNLIQAAALKGVGSIVGIDINNSKKDLILSLGADEFFNTFQSANKKFDVIIDTTGNTDIINNAFNSLSDKGRLVLVGQPKPKESLTLDNALSFFNGNGLVVKATQGGKTDPDIDIPRYIEMHKNGRLNIEKIVTHRFLLSEVNDAFLLLKTGNAGRIMIDMEK